MKDLMTTQEVADLLGIHKNTVYKLIKEGRLKTINLSQRLLRITRADLEEYLANQ